ncbi:MAG: methyl-accepting chemotaxis sensory transducer [Thermoleophilia bacterium]|nr:methyl-accepting chemotaxis sensory transducer [Thermoleophilia bacterium]
MDRTHEAGSAPVGTMLVAAAGAALTVAAAATGGARPWVIAVIAAVSFLSVTSWCAWMLRREWHLRLLAEHRIDAIVTTLRASLEGEGDAPRITEPSHAQLLDAVLDQQRAAVERSIEADRLAMEWTGCVQRLAEGDLASDVAFAAEDELGAALALLQGRQREFADVAGRIADGDLSVSVEPWSERDLMGFALSGMVDGLRSTVSELHVAARNLESSSASMTAVSGEVSRGMEEVATQTSQLASGAESQVKVLDATRDDAERAATSATDAIAVTDRGVEIVERADETMTALADNSREVRDAIRSLSERSARIVDFVGVITTIADQTNLLALNAAIEAARAGDHGRGFAVVADEVRKLAIESQSSAGQIARLVAEIQDQTATTVDVVERTAERADHGTVVVGEARSAFVQIRAAIDEASSRVSGILSSLEEVSAVARDASLSTETVGSATQQTSASMEELDAGAAQTASMATVLAEVAGRFQLEPAVVPPAATPRAYVRPTPPARFAA